MVRETIPKKTKEALLDEYDPTIDALSVEAIGHTYIILTKTLRTMIC